MIRESPVSSSSSPARFQRRRKPGNANVTATNSAQRERRKRQIAAMRTHASPAARNRIFAGRPLAREFAAQAGHALHHQHSDPDTEDFRRSRRSSSTPPPSRANSLVTACTAAFAPRRCPWWPIENQHTRTAREPLGDHHFLLVAARELCTGCSGPGALIASFSIHCARELRFIVRTAPAARRQRRKIRQGDICRHREGQDAALLWRSSNERDVRARSDVAGIGGVDAEQHLRESRFCSGAHEPVDARRSPPAQRERNVSLNSPAARSADRRAAVRRRASLLIFGNSWSTGRPTMSRMSSSPVTSPDLARTHRNTVAEHGIAIREREDLLELCG